MKYEDDVNYLKCDDCGRWKEIPEKNKMLISEDGETRVEWHCLECTGDFDPNEGRLKDTAEPEYYWDCRSR